MFEIDVTSNAVQATRGLLKRLRNFGPALSEVGAYLELKAKRRFINEVAPNGTPWAPLKPSTLRRKKTRGYAIRDKKKVKIQHPTVILRETGGLAASIGFNVSGDEVRVAPALKYGIFHQTGTTKMTARPFMGFEEDDANRIGQIFKDHVEGA